MSTSALYPEQKWTQKQKYGQIQQRSAETCEPRLWVKDQSVLQAPPFPVRVMMMMMETVIPRE